jgi:hypothetical protein
VHWFIWVLLGDHHRDKESCQCLCAFSCAEYKQSYYELERYLMSNCSAVKEKVATAEKQSTKSVSTNKKST